MRRSPDFDWFAKLVPSLADKLSQNHFEESEVEAIATRLHNTPVVFVFYFDGEVDYMAGDFARAMPTYLVVKGQDLCMCCARGEIASIPEFEAVLAPNESAALALRRALRRV